MKHPSVIACLVAEFHRRFGLPVRYEPTLVDVAEAHLRRSLIEEEVNEYFDASWDGNLVEIADALADIVYVAYGAALTYGIDLDAVLSEVHRSNMSKLGQDGCPLRRSDGKVVKGPNYSPPDVARVLGVSANVAHGEDPALD